MKVYTRTGDKGSTSLLGGVKVPKSHLRIESYGNVDELNSFIGLLRDNSSEKSRKDFLVSAQTHLFTIGSHLALAEGKNMDLPELDDSLIDSLESEIDKMDEVLPPLKNFILPGGHTTVSYCHVARSVCRRAERSVVALAENEDVSDHIIRYLNRLSDYLFVLSRKISAELNAEEIPWKPRG